MPSDPIREAPVQRSAHYGPIVLYNEELRKIEGVFKNFEASFVLGEHMSKDILTLADKYKDQTVRYFYVSSEKPRITIDGAHPVVWFTDYGDAADVGTYCLVRNILREAERRPRLIYNPLFIILGTITGLLLTISFCTKLYLSYSHFSAIALAASLVLLCAAVRGWYISICRGCVVNVSDRHAQKGFIERNKDNLVINLIVAVVSAILGILMTPCGP